MKQHMGELTVIAHHMEANRATSLQTEPVKCSAWGIVCKPSLAGIQCCQLHVKSYCFVCFSSRQSTVL